MRSLALIITAIILFSGCSARAQDVIKLPAPETENGMSVQEAIYKRRSTRKFSPGVLSLEEVSQLLWAAGGATIDGVTGPTRSYASAGGIYPLEIYLVAGNVEGLEAGLYEYNWRNNTLKLLDKGDLRGALARASYGQRMISQAQVTIVITAIYEKTASRYGQRGRDLYVPMDAGHVGQNVHLQAESLGLGTVMVGAFTPEAVSRVLKGAKGVPIYIMPIGKKIDGLKDDR